MICGLTVAEKAFRFNLIMNTTFQGLEITETLLIIMYILDQDGFKDNLRKARNVLNKMEL